MRYVGTYRMETPADQRNIALKREHTLRVCREAGFITRGENIPGEDALLATAAALFHDTGRFPQYARFGTFSDRDSVNHGRLGADILVKENFLEGLPAREQSLIIRAVKYHNALAMPKLDKRTALFLKIVRDADKLDIWRVFIEYFGQQKKDRPTAAGLGLPEGERVSTEALRSLLENRTVTLNNVKNLNDFKLLLLSWSFDINFRTTFRIIRRRRLLEKIAAFLPPDKRVEKAVLDLKKFVSQKINTPSQPSPEGWEGV